MQRWSLNVVSFAVEPNPFIVLPSLLLIKGGVLFLFEFVYLCLKGFSIFISSNIRLSMMHNLCELRVAGASVASFMWEQQAREQSLLSVFALGKS